MAPAGPTSFMMYLFHLVAPLVMLFMSIAPFQQGRAPLDRLSEPGAIEQEDAGPPAHASVLDRGRVQAVGTHADLGEAVGRYRRLAEHQGVAA